MSVDIGAINARNAALRRRVDEHDPMIPSVVMDSIVPVVDVPVGAKRGRGRAIGCMNCKRLCVAVTKKEVEVKNLLWRIRKLTSRVGVMPKVYRGQKKRFPERIWKGSPPYQRRFTPRYTRPLVRRRY